MVFSLNLAWIYNWAINGDVGDLRLHRAHYDVIVMGTRVRAVESPLAIVYLNIFAKYILKKWIHNSDIVIRFKSIVVSFSIKAILRFSICIF